MKYSLDPQKARGADDVYSLIPHGGLFVGKITQAKQVFSSSKTEGVEFTFECPSGNATSTLWTVKNGNTTFGHDLVLALMTCLRKKQVVPVEMTVKEYDQAQGKKVDKQGIVYPDLCGDIAIIFQIEEYVKQNGDIGKRANIKHFFDAESLLSASEILDKVAEPTRIYSLKDRYKDILLPASQPTAGGAPTYGSATQNYGQPHSQNNGTPPIDINDDEIPF